MAPCGLKPDFLLWYTKSGPMPVLLIEQKPASIDRHVQAVHWITHELPHLRKPVLLP